MPHLKFNILLLVLGLIFFQQPKFPLKIIYISTATHRKFEKLSDFDDDDRKWDEEGT